jgi:hypothetical protein
MRPTTSRQTESRQAELNQAATTTEEDAPITHTSPKSTQVFGARTFDNTDLRLFAPSVRGVAGQRSASELRNHALSSYVQKTADSVNASVKAKLAEESIDVVLATPNGQKWGVDEESIHLGRRRGGA